MKKLIAIVLVAVMTLSLCACGNKNPYPEYDYIDAMLAAGDYKGAIEAIYELYKQENGGNNENDDDNGSNNDDNGDNGQVQQPTDPPRPSEEEWVVLRYYRELTNKLLRYVEDGSIYIYDAEDNYYEGSAAFGYILSELQSIDTSVIDKWKVTEYCGTNYISDRNGNQINWDVASYLAGFSKLDNVILKQLRSHLDNMENNTQDSDVTYYYNADGSTLRIYNQDYAFELIESNPWGLSGTKECTYDETGKVTKIKYKSGDTVNYIVDLTYDDRGNVINEHVKQNSGEVDITYEYDEFNRLVKIERPYSVGSNTVVTYNYTYNTDGNVVKEEIVYHYFNTSYNVEMVDVKYIREFIYDANGKLTSGYYKYENWSYDAMWIGNGQYQVTQYIYREKLDQYSFTTDNQGRLSKVVLTYGNEYYVSGDKAGQVYDTPDYVSRTYEFVYGDYYFYTPAK